MNDMHWGAQVAVGGVVALIIGLLGTLSNLELLGEPKVVDLKEIQLHSDPPATYVHIRRVAVHYGFGITVERPDRHGEMHRTHYAPIVTPEIAAEHPSGDQLPGVRVLVAAVPTGDGHARLFEEGLTGQLSKGMPLGGRVGISGQLMKRFPGLSAPSVWIFSPSSGAGDISMYLILLIAGLGATIFGIFAVRRWA